MKLFRAPRLLKILIIAFGLIALARMLRADDASQLRDAMALMRKGDYAAALSTAGAPGSLGYDLIEWHRLRSDTGGASFADYRAFLARRPDWPGLPYLQKFGEASIPQGADPGAVAAYFDLTPAQTGRGALIAIDAYRALGREDDATTTALKAWTGFSLLPEEEAGLAERFPKTTARHATERLDMLLWRGLSGEAQRMFPRVSSDWRKLAEARIALRQDKDDVNALIARVPASLRGNPGLAWDRYLWRKAKGQANAVDLLLQVSTAEAMGDPSAWAPERRAVARQLMRDGRYKDAYRVASRHGLKEGDDYSDLEWLSGYIALRHLGDPATALRHFRHFRISVATPISLGRAGYWEGLALEAQGDHANAQTAFAFGAEFQTSFYGLLAAERAGLPMDPALMGTETYPDWRQGRFVQSSVFQASLLLQKAGERTLAKRFLRHLAESLGPTEIGQMADMCIEIGEPHLALSLAKFAADQGIVLNRPYYPLMWLAKARLPVATELALSIARRESEFDPQALSPAGASGLMQLMPGTAAKMAKEMGLPYSPDRLMSDPVYNATLGSEYLAQMIGRYGDNLILVAASYNAGPNRVQQWIDAYGDPRAPGVDPIDWIETIPFEETRNYVQRVAESLPVYRARLDGHVEPITLDRLLKAR